MNRLELALSGANRPDVSKADIAGNAMMGALQSVLAVQRRLEAKWGVGRLQSLAAPDLASKFARALARFERSMDRGDPDDVVARGSALHRGWIALQDSAIEDGHKPVAADGVWMWRSEQGKAFAICQDNNARLDCLSEVESCTAWTLDEIGRVLHYLVLADPMLGQIKEMFGGEIIEIVRGVEKQRKKSEKGSKSENEPFLDDDIPF